MKSFRINSVFHTIQGEGYNAGRRSLFIRMPYCNLKCKWCDTTFNSYAVWTEADIIDFIKKEPTRFIVLTGGEPSMNKDLPDIISILKSLNCEIAIESNGNFEIPDGIDFVTISPKRDAKYFINDDAFNKASEFKYVIDEGFQWTILDRHQNETKKLLSLSPEYGRMKESLKEILSFVSLNPQWKISLQTHKWMEIP